MELLRVHEHSAFSCGNEFRAVRRTLQTYQNEPAALVFFPPGPLLYWQGVHRCRLATGFPSLDLSFSGRSVRKVRFVVRFCS